MGLYAIVASLVAMPVGAWLGPPRVAPAAALVWSVLTCGSAAPIAAEMVVAAWPIPPIAIFPRLRGALRFRSLFL